MTNFKKEYAPEQASDAANLNLQDMADVLDERGISESHAKLMGLALSLAQHAAQCINVGDELAPIIHGVNSSGQHFVVGVAELFDGSKSKEEVGDCLRELMKQADVSYFVMAQDVYMTMMDRKDAGSREEAIKAHADGLKRGELEREEGVILRGEATDGSLLFAGLRIEDNGINRTLMISPPAFMEHSHRNAPIESQGVLVNNYGYLLEVDDAIIH